MRCLRGLSVLTFGSLVLQSRHGREDMVGMLVSFRNKRTFPPTAATCRDSELAHARSHALQRDRVQTGYPLANEQARATHYGPGAQSRPTGVTRK